MCRLYEIVLLFRRRNKEGKDSSAILYERHIYAG